MKISMEIYQKTLVWILFIKEYWTGLRSVYNFKPKTIWIWNEHKEYKKNMSETNTF